MNVCDTNIVREIYLDECVGTSLLTINNNFNNLKKQACTDSEQLSAINTETTTVSSNVIALSALIPGNARAWVAFDGLNVTPSGDAPIYNQYRVLDVKRLSQGNYRINFSPNFTNSNYAVIGTCQQTTLPAWVQSTAFNTMSAGINIRNSTGTFQDSEYVSVIIYNN
jgi:hypothetical protein